MAVVSCRQGDVALHGRSDMEFNALQNLVMQHYEGGGFVALKSLEEVKDHSNEPLLLFLLQESETATDAEELRGRLEDSIDQLQDIIDALEAHLNQQC